jgi:hypothetical protein
MMTLDTTFFTPPLMLYDRTAAELMTPNPKSVRQTATVAEATACLSLLGISEGAGEHRTGGDTGSDRGG